jgi:hypothetical protein
MARSADLERHTLAASEAVAALIDGLASADPPPDVVARLVGDVRCLQRQLVAAVMGLHSKATAHAAAGVGPPVEVVMRDGSSVSEATVHRDRSRALVAETFPAVGRAVDSAVVFPENLDVLARITGRMTADEVTALAEHDTELAAAASRLNVDSFRKKVQRYRDRIRRDHGQTAEQQAAAEECARVSVSRDKNMHLVLAKLHTMHGTAVSTAHQQEIRRLCDELGSGHGLTYDQISAQALHDLIIRGANTTPTQDNNRPTIILHVITDGQTLASGPHDHSIIETGDGLPVCPETLGQIACDCVIQRVDSLPDAKVNVSRISRTTTAGQKAALRALYDCCPISGAPWSQLEVHHVTFVSQGGKTELSNLIPISRRWHHLIHDEGWTLQMDADRTLSLYRPDGTLHRTIPPPIPVLYKQHTHALAA